MTKNMVAARIRTLKRGGDCQDVRRLAPDADVHMWFEPENSCGAIDSKSGASIMYACLNHGYFSIEVKVELDAKRRVVDIGPPLQGSLLVPAPAPDEDYDFNWDVSRVTAAISGRKDDCIISWSMDDGGTAYSAVTLVHALTA